MTASDRPVAVPLSAEEQAHRSRARAWALQVHYRRETSERRGSLTDALEETRKSRTISPRRLPYLRRLVEAMDAHRHSVDERIQSALENWRLERLSIIDRGVLRIGATEMSHLEDVPPKVAIQEAIRLADRYGGAESARFVNGVLDALLKDGSGGE